MHRFRARLIQLAALLLVVSGCSGNGEDILPTDPGLNPGTPTLETFTGTIGLNGADTFPFTVTGVGTITAQLMSLTPDSAQLIGMSLGTWNSNDTCQVVLAKDAATQGTSILGQSTTPGNFCVRVYDAAGTVVQTQDYVIEVRHP